MKIRRTQRQLLEAFLNLTRKPHISYKKITISDITEAAGFTRRVFFNHFESKDQFLETAVEYMLSDDALYDGSLNTGDTFFLITSHLNDYYQFCYECAHSMPLSAKLYDLLIGILTQSMQRELSTGSAGYDSAQKTLLFFVPRVLTTNLISRSFHHAAIADKQEYSLDINLSRRFLDSLSRQKLTLLEAALSSAGMVLPTREARKLAELMSALKTLTAKEIFHKISVKEITDLAGVSRSYFYRHSLTKYSLRNQVWIHDITAMMKSCMTAAHTLDATAFREMLSAYYAENYNLYQSDSIYTERDSVYYSLQRQFRNQMLSFAKISARTLSDRKFAFESISCILADIVIISIFEPEKDLDELSISQSHDMLFNCAIWDQFTLSDLR